VSCIILFSEIVYCLPFLVLIPRHRHLSGGGEWTAGARRQTTCTAHIRGVHRLLSRPQVGIIFDFFFLLPFFSFAVYLLPFFCKYPRTQSQGPSSEDEVGQIPQGGAARASAGARANTCQAAVSRACHEAATTDAVPQPDRRRWSESDASSAQCECAYRRASEAAISHADANEIQRDGPTTLANANAIASQH
jgi:hypothetical protein